MSIPDPSYQDRIKRLAADAEQLETVYQAALKAGDTTAFQAAIEASYFAAPENLLYAAWFYRLKQTAVKAKEYAVSWAWVTPLALLNALLLWWLSGDQFMIAISSFRGLERDFMPAIFWLAGPLSALFVLTYLTIVGHKNWRLSALISLLLLAAAGYVLLIYPQLGTEFFQEQYLTLMIMHLPLLAWAGIGAFLMSRHRDPENRFAFLIKSLEVFIVGGLFVIAGFLFTGITAGLFQALDVELPEEVLRLFFAGGLGFIVVVAAAVIYNPAEPPIRQDFDEGLSKLVALLMRVLLPLTLIVGLVYLVFILFNFRAPFDNREVLVIYNIMLFAIIALLVGATPLSLKEISPRLARWLRWGIIAVAALALLVSLYALTAIIYRTSIDRLTPNRLAFIGWNIVNIGLLMVLLFLQFRGGKDKWLHELHRAFSAGTIAYAAWTLVVILALPWLFGIDQGAIEELPLSVQRAVYEYPDPVLLKCYNSPHIYLLENGQKRWIDTIETFEERGYVWRDVRFVPCQDLRAVPDGIPIPPDAGPPPQPWDQ
jgi:hypothetical protein